MLGDDLVVLEVDFSATPGIAGEIPAERSGIARSGGGVVPAKNLDDLVLVHAVGDAVEVFLGELGIVGCPGTGGDNQSAQKCERERPGRGRHGIPVRAIVYGRLRTNGIRESRTVWSWVNAGL
jgi:hypothetical protein